MLGIKIMKWIFLYYFSASLTFVSSSLRMTYFVCWVTPVFFSSYNVLIPLSISTLTMFLLLHIHPSINVYHRLSTLHFKCCVIFMLKNRLMNFFIVISSIILLQMQCIKWMDWTVQYILVFSNI